MQGMLPTEGMDPWELRPQTSQGCSLHPPGAGCSLGTGSLSVPGRCSLVSPSPEGAAHCRGPLKPYLRTG